jgi:ATP-dependent Clp protease ATP-binding subunit ClpB
VCRKPYPVVLFDEIEKAYPCVFNTLQHVIIMTSNIGSEYLLDGVTAAGELKPEARELVPGELLRQFRPEFKPLTSAQIEQIVDLQSNTLRRRLAERRMKLEVTDEARRLRSYIAREVETAIGRALLGGDVGEGGEPIVTYSSPPEGEEVA